MPHQFATVLTLPISDQPRSNARYVSGHALDRDFSRGPSSYLKLEIQSFTDFARLQKSTLLQRKFL